MSQQYAGGGAAAGQPRLAFGAKQSNVDTDSVAAQAIAQQAGSLATARYEFPSSMHPKKEAAVGNPMSILAAGGNIYNLLQYRRVSDELQTQGQGRLRSPYAYVRNMTDFIGRGLYDAPVGAAPVLSNKVRQEHLWEQQQINQYGGFCNYTFFPATIAFSDEVKQSLKFSQADVADWLVIPYICIYSSQPVSAASIGSHYNINFPMTYDSHPTVWNKHNQSNEVINICSQFVHGADASLSIQASASNCGIYYRKGDAANNVNEIQSYITIIPWLEPAFAQKLFAIGGYTILNCGGASMGLAVAAAILGGAPVMYSGMLRTLGTDRMATSEQFRADPSKTTYTTLNPGDYIANVQNLFLKAQLAVTSSFPLVFPHQTILGQATDLVIANAAKMQSNTKSAAGHLVHWTHTQNAGQFLGSQFYTMAKAEDNVNYYETAATLLMAITLTEAVILGAYAGSYYCTDKYQQFGVNVGITAWRTATSVLVDLATDQKINQKKIQGQQAKLKAKLRPKKEDIVGRKGAVTARAKKSKETAESNRAKRDLRVDSSVARQVLRIDNPAQYKTDFPSVKKAQLAQMQQRGGFGTVGKRVRNATLVQRLASGENQELIRAEYKQFGYQDADIDLAIQEALADIATGRAVKPIGFRPRGQVQSGSGSAPAQVQGGGGGAQVQTPGGSAGTGDKDEDLPDLLLLSDDELRQLDDETLSNALRQLSPQEQAEINAKLGVGAGSRRAR